MTRGRRQAPTALFARPQASIHRIVSFAVLVKIKNPYSKDLLVSFAKPPKELLTSN
jgi:hypothetical protein